MPLYRNRAAALLAVLAITLQALWPLVAQARPVGPGIPVPVCTINGITHYLEIPAPKSPLEESSSAHREHCQLCLFGAERAALSANGARADFSGIGADRRVASAALPQSQHPLRLPAQPRAPPLAS
jgi:DUF2946 family protein